jgi:hypothetical protein
MAPTGISVLAFMAEPTAIMGIILRAYGGMVTAAVSSIEITEPNLIPTKVV